MTNKEEQAYLAGKRSVYLHAITDAMSALGYTNNDSLAAQARRWVVEREQILLQLRAVCADFGDTDWDEQDHLGDVIEKHLANHLHDKKWRKRL